MGVNLMAVTANPFGEAAPFRIPELLRGPWETDPVIQHARRAICRFDYGAIHVSQWDSRHVLVYTGNDGSLAEIDGPDGWIGYVQRGWLDFHHTSRYRHHFLPDPNVSGPLRVMGRAIAAAFGVPWVMYLPDFATDIPDELWSTISADGIRQRLIDEGNTFFDITGVPDDACLREFATGSADPDWPYFFESPASTAIGSSAVH